MRYELRDASSGELVVVASRLAFSGRRSSGREDLGPPVRTAPVAPGQAVRITEDLARYCQTPPAPGDYRLVARYRHGGLEAGSPPVPQRVRPPRIQHQVSLICPLRRSCCSLVAHDPGDGSSRLFQLETARSDPGDGTLQHRMDLASPPADLALAAHAARVGFRDRWFAWVVDGQVGAARTSGATLPRSPLHWRWP